MQHSVIEQHIPGSAALPSYGLWVLPGTLGCHAGFVPW
jgi:hypothetical protein